MEPTTFTKRASSVDEINKSVFVDRRQLLVWRIFHGTHFLLGGLCFIAGSCMYFTTVYEPRPGALVAGGWLFTIGSLFFLLADLQEWSHYLKGYWFCCLHRKEYEDSNAGMFRHSRSSLLGLWERSEVGINVFVSVCGSIFYLIGSIFFIPALSDYLITGDWLFIVGSILIFLSQGWKVYRMSRTNPDDQTDHSFRFVNLSRDIPAFFADAFTGFGGFFYCVGTILFLPRFNGNDSDENRASILFVLGGCSFTIGGFFLQYIYYCSRHK
ncbi:unnamed protein product [Rotaria sp. Silwood2]|nr:unnamed protein product [Rotaria sp. Silwood2]CAF2812352.1 unnamed protein product [Rotaria sp. Silwood2]CAF3068123.1 unnamed protein product [Rotaria sp. Silwood2]CAF3225241.1 unnamed protein product [Rotaria sp. Silwood2]CAF4234535.1 unnamed protein product [Rotaria sp. Silwood2]